MNDDTPNHASVSAQEMRAEAQRLIQESKTAPHPQAMQLIQEAMELLQTSIGATRHSE